MKDHKDLSGTKLPEKYKHLDVLFYTVEDTCQILALGRTSVYSLLKSQDLIRVKWRRRTLVLRESVHEYAFRLMGGE